MRILMGILPLLFIFDIEAGTQTVPLFPAASDNRQGFMRIINPAGRAGTVHITAHSDAGERRIETLSFEEGEEVKFFTSDDLENGNVQKGIVTGIGAGEGDWRLQLTSDLAFVAPVYLRTKRDGFLTSLHDTVPVEDGAHRAHIFNPGSNTGQRSILRIVNLSDTAVSATITGTDDRGNPGLGVVTERVGANGAVMLGARELETRGLGDGDGKWRLAVTAPGPILVMSLMESPTGHLTNLSTAPEVGATLVPFFPAASDNRQGFIRVINETDTERTVTFTAIDDGRTPVERGTVSLSVGPNQVEHFNSDDLENGNEGKGIMTGVGTGNGDWRLIVDGRVRVLTYMRNKRDGFLTSLHDVVSGRHNRYDIATFNPASNERQRSFIRVINPNEISLVYYIPARDDAGAVGDESLEDIIEPNENKTFTSQTMERLWFGDGTGKWRLQARANSPFIVMNLMETPTGHLTNLSTIPGPPLPLLNIFAHEGQRALIERIEEGGGHTGKAVVWELRAGVVYENSHAERMFYTMVDQGVPPEHLVAPGPELTEDRDSALYGVEGFLRPVHDALRAETLVVNRSVATAFSTGNADLIRPLNIVWVVAAGNVRASRQCITDRDFWHSGNVVACGYDLSSYYSPMLNALETGKALMATAAVRREDGTIVPDEGVYKCGDMMEHCFAVPGAGTTSVATARVSAAVFHLFQLYENAEEVVRALKSCVEDVGEPGIDREFGLGVIDFRCSEAMLPVVER